LLFQSGGAVIVSTVAATALATEPPRRDRESPHELQALIEAHKTAYLALGKVVREKGSSRDYDGASRAEERALLAICAYPTVRRGDRLAKARYLLEIEARGELDLPEHMQALLRSTMWKA